MLFFIILFSCLLLLAGWVLLAPFELECDTRIPKLQLRWKTIGSAEILYTDEWRLEYRILFFKRTVSFPLKGKDRKTIREKKEQPGKKKSRKKISAARMLKKSGRVLSSFRVRYWNWALDTGDYTLNGRLYPANYLPFLQGHLQVNFNGVNYFSCRVQNRLGRILIAWFR